MARCGAPVGRGVRVASLVSTAVMAGLWLSAAANPLTDGQLAAEGVAKACIVIPDRPTDVERSAARELADGLRKVSGAAFGIVPESEAKAGLKLYVGATQAAKVLRTGGDWKLDEVLVDNVADGIVFAGHPDRGPLYAVDCYLERELGVRWWTSKAARYPRNPSPSVRVKRYSHVSPFKFRETYWLDAFDTDFKVRHKMNFTSICRYEFERNRRIPKEKGGDFTFYVYKGRGSYCHSFFEVLPPARYFKEHPEWYSLVDGRRQPLQLCCSNAEMMREYVRVTKELLRTEPDVNFISLSQNDQQGPCECEACRAIEAEEGGAHSGPTLRMANALSDALAEEFPHVWVDTLAYQYTRKAPTKTRPRPNVLIRLCAIECGFNRPISDPKFAENRAFMRDLEEWRKVAGGNLFLFDYPVDYPSYMMPNPTIPTFADNLRTFVKSGAVGLFELGDATCSAGEFAPLRCYLLAKLAWDPEADAEALIAEFLEGYYGRGAAPHLAAYLKRTHEAARESGPLLCYHWRIADCIPPETFLAAAADMDAALAAAEREGPAFAERVRRERMSVDHAFIVDWDVWRTWAADHGRPWPRARTRKEMVENWIAACAELGVKSYDETVDPDEINRYFASLRSESAVEMPSVSIGKDRPPAAAELRCKASLDSLARTARVCRESGRDLVVTVGTDGGEESVAFQTRAALAFGALRVNCAEDGQVGAARRSVERLLPLYEGYRNLATHFGTNAVNVGHVRELHAADGTPLLVGEMLERTLAPCGRRAFLVVPVAAGSARSCTIRFRAAGEVSASGADGALAVTRDADRVSSVEIAADGYAFVRIDPNVRDKWIDVGLKNGYGLDRTKLLLGVWRVHPNLRTREGLKELADCGCDVAAIISSTNNLAAFEAFQANNMGVFLNRMEGAGDDNTMPWWGSWREKGQLDLPKMLAAYDATKSTYREHLAIWGITVCDEPTALDFPYLGPVVDHLKHLFPGRLVYFDLLPTYGSVASVGADVAKSQLGTHTYREHIDRYCEWIPLDYLSFDYFVYQDPKNRDLVRYYYQNCDIVANACRASGRSMWLAPQVNSLEPDFWPSANNLRFQAYSSLAYGNEMVNWCCWSDYNGWWTNEVIDVRGKRTQQYDKLKAVNAELRRIGPAYMRYRNVATHYVGFEGTDWLQGPLHGGRPLVSVPQLETVGFRGVRAADGKPLIVGDMVARDGGRGRALFVFAADDPYDENPQKRTVRFRAADGRRVRVSGPDGTVAVRDANGLKTAPIASNGFLLIETEN